MIVSSVPQPSGLVALLNAQVGELIWSMGVPVIVGARRPAVGSLVHQVAFSAHDRATEALDAIEGMVRRDREDDAKQDRILRWGERERERYPPDRTIVFKAQR